MWPMPPRPVLHMAQLPLLPNIRRLYTVMANKSPYLGRG